MKPKTLGKSTKYRFDKPDAKILDRFQNKHQDNLYLVPFVMERDEFTSLCPITSQPDQARMEVIYVPDEWCVESKSLKLYFFSYRNHGEYHEDVCNKIADDLFALLEPRYLRVFGDFSPRGGLAIKPLVERWRSITEPEANKIMFLTKSWDAKRR